jgi:PD-(D/E)XK nuclease superfamily
MMTARERQALDRHLTREPEPDDATNEDSGLAAVLSPSQKRCFTDCQFRWWAKYGLELPETRTAALGLGSAFHRVIAENFRNKLEVGADIPYTGLRPVFLDALAQELDTVTLTPEDDTEELRVCGEAMLRKYMDDIAPGIEPIAVELPVSGTIGGVHVQGYVDLLDANGTIIDTKTAAKKPYGISPDHRFQVATYSHLLNGGNTGHGRIDTVTKCKTVSAVQQSFDVDAADIKEVETTYPLVQAAMRNGYYVPNRNSLLCSRKHCSFWRECESEFGGRVKE